MDKEKIIIRELNALGQYYRNDWADFDGRTLKRELISLIEWIEKPRDIEFNQFSELLGFQEKEFECEHEWEIIDQFNENVVYCKCELCGKESHFLKQHANTNQGGKFER